MKFSTRTYRVLQYFLLYKKSYHISKNSQEPRGTPKGSQKFGISNKSCKSERWLLTAMTDDGHMTPGMMKRKPTKKKHRKHKIRMIEDKAQNQIYYLHQSTAPTFIYPTQYNFYLLHFSCMQGQLKHMDLIRNLYNCRTRDESLSTPKVLCLFKHQNNENNQQQFLPISSISWKST